MLDLRLLRVGLLGLAGDLNVDGAEFIQRLNAVSGGFKTFGFQDLRL